ncbi:hypothetical protein QFC19_004505 [Naganishia cerealis]|uniref:Uncharacterized protein n=1 Tax=Naganishia cerealis TaxID=610337 RepID=A0ACC2VV46_9TREE|nr:hypothetical protein QFC19_004505 [Naganishia cerealis]
MESFTFRNAYQPPSKITSRVPTHGDTLPEEYDLNFNGGPVPILSSSKVTLIPFLPAWHARHYAHHLQNDEDLVKWMPYSPNPAHGYEELLECYEKNLRGMPGSVLFSVFDTSGKTSAQPAIPGNVQLPDWHPPMETFAGVMGLLNTDRDSLVTEIGHILILRHAQRTHVSSHAIGLLMHYALDHPYVEIPSSRVPSLRSGSSVEEVEPLLSPFVASPTSQPQRALGLRRCQWQCHHLNAPSSRAAQRMGFSPEGIIRMQRIVASGDEPGRKGDGGFTGSRSSWVGSVTWYDWESNGVKDLVDRQMSRET